MFYFYFSFLFQSLSHSFSLSLSLSIYLSTAQKNDCVQRAMQRTWRGAAVIIIDPTREYSSANRINLELADFFLIHFARKRFFRAKNHRQSKRSCRIQKLEISGFFFLIPPTE
jgi:hypothetical protein